MIHSKIPLSETNLISPIVKDYLAQVHSLKPFYNEPNAIEGYQKLILERNFAEEKRVILYQSLLKQYEETGLSFERFHELGANLSLLKESNTFTVTTGHQLCLYGGPLFLTYKILTTIKLCSELKKEYRDFNFVPVLWLASEDHDFEEINHIHLYGADFKWDKESHNKPVGTLDLGGLKEDVERISLLINNKNETGKNWIKLIEDAYLKSSNLSEASIKIYTEIFKSYGLIVLDPNRTEYKQQLIQVMKADILKQCSFHAQTNTDKILAEKYKLKINAREINFFYLHHSLGRKIIRKVEDNFFLAGSDIKFSVSEMEHEIENYPERFSPNVNLRPVFEEIILPNLAYVGGPAEVAYWLQLKPIFDYYEVRFPVVILRAMNLLAGKPFIEKVEKTGIQINQFIGSELELLQAYYKQEKKLDFLESFHVILEEFQKIVDGSKKIDQEVSKALLETKLSLKDFFKQKNRDLKKSIGNNEAGEIEKIVKLRSKIFPKDVFQERMDTLLQHEVNADRNLLSILYDEMDVFENNLVVSVIS